MSAKRTRIVKEKVAATGKRKTQIGEIKELQEKINVREKELAGLPLIANKLQLDRITVLSKGVNLNKEIKKLKRKKRFLEDELYGPTMYR